ncbi:ABC transporter ATP-binding protein [Longirhabdus pacifica]|uniref:ABC transporter ATP-binding protein n=1 Tax=Longirhabdus pacifica TaxID=2305227 RepID=UPI001008E6AB|nr:ABC transporter ATP-binding protein [Longirhabdus pacifica]
MKTQDVTEKPILEVNNLETGFTIDNKFYNAVDKVSFSVKPNKIVGIVGESGCGKSVMSLSIMNLLPKGIGEIANGTILFDGNEINKLNNNEMNKIRGKDMSMIFQEPMTALNPVFTVGYQIMETLINHSDISKKDAKLKSIDLLKSVGIPRPEKIVDEYPHQLSGGMRQRVMIAIAIACKPKLLIADEPTTALDVTVQAQILELMKTIQQENNMSIILITHDLGVVAEMCDEVIVMYAGKIVEKTDVDTLFHNPKHPYTKALIQSVPKLDVIQETLGTISGIVPSLKNMPEQGCRFVDRCSMAKSECRTKTPTLKPTVDLGQADDSKEHLVSCLLYDEA